MRLKNELIFLHALVKIDKLGKYSIIVGSGITVELSIKACKNTELRREFIENYVLAELQDKIFNDEAIRVLAQQLTKFQAKKDTTYKNEGARLEKNLRETEKQIDNLVNAIAGIMAQVALLQKLEELEKQIFLWNNKWLTIKLNKAAVTEGALQQLFSTLKQHVAERNIPEIKKFIGSYVEKVIIYKEHVELILNLKVIESKNPQPRTVVDLHGGGEGI